MTEHDIFIMCMIGLAVIAGMAVTFSPWWWR